MPGAAPPLVYANAGIQFQLGGTKSGCNLRLNDIATNSTSLTAVPASSDNPDPGTWFFTFTDNSGVRPGHGFVSAQNNMQVIMAPNLVTFAFPEYGPSLARLFDLIPDRTVSSGQAFYIVTQYEPKQALQINQTKGATGVSYTVNTVPWGGADPKIETFKFVWATPVYTGLNYQMSQVHVIEGAEKINKVVNFDTPQNDQWYIMDYDVNGSWTWTFDNFPLKSVNIDSGPFWSDTSDFDALVPRLPTPLGQAVTFSIPTEQSIHIPTGTQQVQLRQIAYTATVPCTMSCNGGSATGQSTFSGTCVVNSWYKSDLTSSLTKSNPT